MLETPATCPGSKDAVSLPARTDESQHGHFLCHSLYLICSTVCRPGCFTTPFISPFSPPHARSDSPHLLRLSSFTGALEEELSKAACVIITRLPPPNHHQHHQPDSFTLHSHPGLPIINPSLPSVKRRNAGVHSRLNEVNIAGIWP